MNDDGSCGSPKRHVIGEVRAEVVGEVREVRQIREVVGEVREQVREVVGEVGESRVREVREVGEVRQVRQIREVRQIRGVRQLRQVSGSRCRSAAVVPAAEEDDQGGDHGGHGEARQRQEATGTFPLLGSVGIRTGRRVREARSGVPAIGGPATGWATVSPPVPGEVTSVGVSPGGSVEPRRRRRPGRSTPCRPSSDSRGARGDPAASRRPHRPDRSSRASPGSSRRAPAPEAGGLRTVARTDHRRREAAAPAAPGTADGRGGPVARVPGSAPSRSCGSGAPWLRPWWRPPCWPPAARPASTGSRPRRNDGPAPACASGWPHGRSTRRGSSSPTPNRRRVTACPRSRSWPTPRTGTARWTRPWPTPRSAPARAVGDVAGIPARRTLPPARTVSRRHRRRSTGTTDTARPRPRPPCGAPSVASRRWRRRRPWSSSSWLTRLPRLGRPRSMVFDEVYYALDAADLLRHGVESSPAHPPLAKWFIAAGIRVVRVHAGRLAIRIAPRRHRPGARHLAGRPQGHRPRRPGLPRRVPRGPRRHRLRHRPPRPPRRLRRRRHHGGGLVCARRPGRPGRPRPSPALALGRRRAPRAGHRHEVGCGLDLAGRRHGPRQPRASGRGPGGAPPTGDGDGPRRPDPRPRGPVRGLLRLLVRPCRTHPGRPRPLRGRVPLSARPRRTARRVRRPPADPGRLPCRAGHRQPRGRPGLVVGDPDPPGQPVQQALSTRDDRGPRRPRRRCLHRRRRGDRRPPAGLGQPRVVVRRAPGPRDPRGPGRPAGRRRRRCPARSGGGPVAALDADRP